MCDADDGFGGVGSSILTCLEDEFPRKPTMAVPVSDRDVLSVRSPVCIDASVTFCYVH